MEIPLKRQTFAILLADWFGHDGNPADIFPDELGHIDTTGLAQELMDDIRHLLAQPDAAN